MFRLISFLYQLVGRIYLLMLSYTLLLVGNMDWLVPMGKLRVVNFYQVCYYIMNVLLFLRHGKTTLLNHIANKQLAIPPHIDVLLCEQGVWVYACVLYVCCVCICRCVCVCVCSVCVHTLFILILQH